MAGWADSGSSRGRGGGGGGFANRGGANNSNTRWRARTPAQQQQQQHQHQQQQHQQHQQQQLPQHQQQPHQQHQYQRRYRPVNDNDQSSQHQGPSGELNTHRGQGGFSTSEEYNTHRGQGGFSTSEELNTHRGQGGFSTSTRRPQPTRPPHARPTSTDHKSPAPATDADANAIANEPDDKARRNAANFECNVCFDMAGDPVVTKCGHLFCWECLYQWLHVHSHHRECPVCKGQVADDAIIPIYGRGGSAASVHAAPPRPTGARVESSRQQQMQAALDWHEEDNPFAMMSAMMSLMPDLPMETTDDYDDDDFLNTYHRHHFFDEVYYDLSGSPEYASAGAGSSRRHGHHTSVSDDIMETFYDNTTHQEPDSVYRGGRRQRGRARGAASADHPIFFELERGTTLVLDGSNSSSFRHTGAGPHINNAGGSSRPNGGWTERRGRSNRNSNSGGGVRGGQNNSRRQGAHYNY